MPSIFDIFQSNISDAHVDEIAKRIGADSSQTRDAISVTLPTMIEALARHTEQNGSADQLHSQLNQMSAGSGSMLDQLNQSFGQDSTSTYPTPSAAPKKSSPTTSSTGSTDPDVFSDALGDKRGKVADAVGKSSGISSSQAGALIAILGPLILRFLAQQTRSGKLSPTDLGGVLQEDRARVQQTSGGGLLGKLLDQDGDGDFDFNDILKLGMSLVFRK